MKRIYMAAAALLVASTLLLQFPRLRAAEGGELPVAKNINVYRAYCLSCHSSSYVIKLPKTTRNVWEAEVKKMVDVYSADIPPDEQKLIVDYLMIVRGLPETPEK